MSVAPVSCLQPVDLDGRRLDIPGLEAASLALRAIPPSPCTEACPAGINVKSYVSLIAEGRFAEALEVVRQRCPLPGICGRICHHPCEGACERATSGGPIAIRALKRFVADLELELPLPEPSPVPTRAERVAVVGSGPAGLTAAYDLALAGHPVTVFEAEPELGGMLRYGIADYRLPPAVLDHEIQVLARAGIEFRTGHRLGTDGDLGDLLADGGYAAVLLAVGAQRGRRLGIEGEAECNAIEDALTFLRRVNRGDRTPIDGRVLVIGGGSTAIEAARAALRLGAETVEIVYRRQRAEMPADEEEIDLAAAEGVGFRFLTAPARALVDGGTLQALECLAIELGEPDASGRRRPLPLAGSEFRLAADRVFAAVGQEAVFDFLPERVGERMTAGGRLTVDSAGGMTRLRGIFAAGDVVTGPATVIDAIAAGHEVAAAIRAFLEGKEAGETHPSACGEIEYEIRPPAPRPLSRRHPALARIAPGREFDEVEHAFTADDAIAEAQRCLRCGPCGECRICAASCDRRHLVLQLDGAAPWSGLVRVPASLALGLEPLTAWLEDDVAGLPVGLLPTRIAIDETHCRGCAKCIEVCTFDALSLVDPEAPETTARVDPALCRGCNLCVAVCPTDAAHPVALTPGCWSDPLAELLPRLAAAPEDLRPPIVLACQRRAAAVDASLAAQDVEVELLPVRCCGQLEAGLLLELYRHGAGSILVAGCLDGNCRYGSGGRLAAEQVERAQTLLFNLGSNPGFVAGDWSPAIAGEDLGLEMGLAARGGRT